MRRRLKLSEVELENVALRRQVTALTVELNMALGKIQARKESDEYHGCPAARWATTQRRMR